MTRPPENGRKGRSHDGRAGRALVLRIAVVYTDEPAVDGERSKMSSIRWHRISEGLARLGHGVDLITDARRFPPPRVPGLRYVPFSAVDWADYDVVKTLFHKGFDCLHRHGGGEHPFVISKLGSVVGADDAAAGVHFFGAEREALHRSQDRIARASRYVTLLTRPSADLWRELYGERRNVLLVPTGVDRELPPPGPNPYRDIAEPVAIYLGNLYGPTQKDVNLYWQERLNRLGRDLKERGIRLCFVGPGHVEGLDPQAVTCLPPVDHERVWDYQRWAAVGIVLALGPVQHNESSKIYGYLRTGLPVVSETPVPNNDLLLETGLGLIADYGDDRMMGDMIEEAVAREWPRDDAIRFMLAHHTWDHRATIYDELLCSQFHPADRGARTGRRERQPRRDFRPAAPE